MLRQFPFRILGFHSDNGSEFINKTVAELLDKMLIEQTKSRPRQSGDNGLVETKKRRHHSQTYWLRLHRRQTRRRPQQLL
jgi:transposase InsO family protein